MGAGGKREGDVMRSIIFKEVETKNKIKMETKWKVCVDKSRQLIKIKGDDSIERPIALVLTPASGNWMGNKPQLNSAMEKATLMAAAPELLEACILALKMPQCEQIKTKLGDAIKKATEL